MMSKYITTTRVQESMEIICICSQAIRRVLAVMTALVSALPTGVVVIRISAEGMFIRSVRGVGAQIPVINADLSPLVYVCETVEQCVSTAQVG
jgi:hypothetical protein